jgi:hypothetical protein
VRWVTRLPELESDVSQEAVQSALADAAKAYARRFDDGERFPPFRPNALTATEAAIVCSQILKTANIALFELAMWEAMGRA